MRVCGLPILARPDRLRHRRPGVRETLISSHDVSSGARPAAGLRLDLVLEPGDHIEGHVNVTGEASGVPFRGWVELMAAVDTLRSRRGRSADITVPVTGRTAEPVHRARRRRQG